MFVVEETIFNVSFYKGVDEPGCFSDCLSEKSKEFFLVFRSGGLKSDFVADTIEKSQSEKFIE